MWKNLPKMVKIIFVILAVPVGCFLATICIETFVLTLVSHQQTVAWRRSTSPLPEQVVEDLCNKMSLPPEDRLCTSDEIMAPDFYPIIRKTFPPGEATYEEIQTVLGDYLWEKEPLSPLGDGQKYYRVSYDLRGDRASTILYYFYENGLSFQVTEYFEGID